MTDRWSRASLAVGSEALAASLLGSVLVRVLDDGTRVSGRIVETEAYLGVEDRAAHSFGGRRTARNESMYARAGTAYVYFTYGMHHCANVVAGSEGEPVAVLIRALEPLDGLVAMRVMRAQRPRRTSLTDRDLCRGPGRLCEAMGIDRALDGEDLVGGERLWLERGKRPQVISRSARVGIGNAGEWASSPLRFCDAGSRFLSRPAGSVFQRSSGSGGSGR